MKLILRHNSMNHMLKDWNHF